MNSLLSLVTFLPLIGAVVLLLFLGGDDAAAQKNAKMLALVTTIATFLISLFILAGYDTANPGFQFVEERPWIGGLNYKMGVDGISVLVRDADDLPDADHHPLDLGGARPGQGVHGRLPGARDADARRLLRARPRALLHLLRGRPDPDVPDHRHLGRQGPHLRRVQVLPLHLPRLGADAGRDDRDVLAGRHHRHPDAAHLQLRLRSDPRARVHHRRRGADAALARLLRELRGEDADVAGAHLAAGRARAGADGGLGDPGGDPPEDGRLRLPALLGADVPGRLRA